MVDIKACCTCTNANELLAIIIIIASFQYTFCSNPWLVLVPMVIERAGFGLAEGCTAPVLNNLAASINPDLTGAINGMFLASFNTGVMTGRQYCYRILCIL